MAANWFNRFTKWWASSGTLQDPSDTQAAAGWSYIGQAPPTVEQFNSVQQWNDQKDNYLYGQIASVLAWGGQTPIDTNPNTLRDAISGKFKTILTANQNYYVDLAGNDSTGNGSVGSPWRTLQFAVNWITSKIDPAGFNINLQLKSPGTYDPVIFTVPINGLWIITGDKLNPRNYTIKNTNGAAVVLQQGVIAAVFGFSVEAVGQSTGQDYKTVGHGFYATRGSIIYYDAVALGPCSHCQMSADQSGQIFPWNAAATTLSVYGGGQFMFSAGAGGGVTVVSVATTITGNPNYTAAVMQSVISGNLNVSYWVPTGTATGIKYIVAYNGVLTTLNAGASIPGNSPGQVSFGGQMS